MTVSKPVRLGLLMLVCAVFVGIPADVSASRIVYRDITVEQAASMASMVLVATHLATADDHGPVHRFRVERVLVGAGLTTGGEIRVRPAHYTEWTTAMRVAETTGMRRSPLIYRIPSPPALELQPSARFCLLLDDSSVDPNAMELAVEGGHLPESMCAQVVAHREGG